MCGGSRKDGPPETRRIESRPRRRYGQRRDVGEYGVVVPIEEE